MYLLISTYSAPLDEVDAARAEHLAFLDGLEERGVLVTAGRQTPPAGGVVIIEAETEAQARELIAGDPYVQRGLAEYSVVGWQPARGALANWSKS